jgi:oligopeptide/dipeptide ABC transporter ATP-binding protein
MALLEVDDLHVRFRTSRGIVDAVRGVSFCVAAGETLGVVGESGSGKSVTARAIMRLLPMPPAEVHRGRVSFEGVDLLRLSDKEMRRYRGSKIAMIYQDPMRALNPTMRVGAQIAEAVTAHHSELGHTAVRTRVLELLDAVQIPAAADRAQSYPHQLSGGMRQRVVIAMALACNPSLLIADEPTTALDVTVQAEILDLLAQLQTELDMAMILVTHDLGVASWHAHRIMVMYDGSIVEQAPTQEIFAAMRMPYTRALFDSIPRLEQSSHVPLPAISGQPPDGFEHIPGCSFHPRCGHGDERCALEAPALVADGDHEWACFHPLTLHSTKVAR